MTKWMRSSLMSREIVVVLVTTGYSIDQHDIDKVCTTKKERDSMI